MGKYNTLFAVDIKALNAASSVLNIARLPLIMRENNTLKRNTELLKYKKSNICYIVGLGPSLKSVDFKKVNGDVIATNRYVYYKEANLLTPTYYCLPDSAFYSEGNSDVLRAAEKSFPNTVFLLNGKNKAAAEKIISNKSRAYYTFTWGGYLRPEKNLDFCKVLPLIGNVVCYAIMLALYLGYEKIYLIGCDFSSFASRSSIHCYEEKDDNRGISMSYELFCYSFVAYIHDQLEKYSKLRNISIINATDNSLIDAYYYDKEMIEYLKK